MAGAELWVDPEIDQGFALGNTHGVAGFPSAEGFRLGLAEPYALVATRGLLRQTIDLGGATEKVEANLNQFANSTTADRLVLTLGRFFITDLFGHQQICKQSQNRFSKLVARKRGYVRLCRRRPGLDLRRGSGMVPRPLHTARRCFRPFHNSGAGGISPLGGTNDPTFPAHSNGLAKSRSGTDCGGSRARLRSLRFSRTDAWEPLPTPLHSSRPILMRTPAQASTRCAAGTSGPAYISTWSSRTTRRPATGAAKALGTTAPAVLAGLRYCGAGFGVAVLRRLAKPLLQARGTAEAPLSQAVSRHGSPGLS